MNEDCMSRPSPLPSTTLNTALAPCCPAVVQSSIFNPKKCHHNVETSPRRRRQHQSCRRHPLNTMKILMRPAPPAEKPRRRVARPQTKTNALLQTVEEYLHQKVKDARMYESVSESVYGSFHWSVHGSVFDNCVISIAQVCFPPTRLS
jgi:hypothetical protein